MWFREYIRMTILISMKVYMRIDWHTTLVGRDTYRERTKREGWKRYNTTQKRYGGRDRKQLREREREREAGVGGAERERGRER